MKSDRQLWLLLSHAFNMDGRAASQTITDRIPYLLSHGIKPIVLSAVTGRRDTVVEHHQLLPVSPVGLRFDLRFVLRRHISSRLGYKTAVGLMTLLMLPFYVLEKVFIRLEPQWSWFVTAYFVGGRIIRDRKPAVILETGGFEKSYRGKVAGTNLAPSSNPHNEYLMIGSQLGIVGLIAFIAMLVVFMATVRLAGERIGT